METEKVFRTKTGHCHILPDKILLTRSGAVGSVAKVMFGNSMARILVVYTVIAVFVVYNSWLAFQQQELLIASLYGGLGIVVVYNIVRSWHYSAAPEVDRCAIQNVVFKPAASGLTRAYFEVYYTDQRGRRKKRLIMLPGTLAGGATETERALKIMREEGLISG